MKLIKAYLRYFKTEDVYMALKKAGCYDVTFEKCLGTGRHVGSTKRKMGTKENFIEANKTIKLEIVATNESVDNIVKIIKEYGRTGYPGDGIITVSPVDEVYPISTMANKFNQLNIKW